MESLLFPTRKVRQTASGRFTPGVDEVLVLSLATCSAAVAAELADIGAEKRSGRHRRCLHLRLRDLSVLAHYPSNGLLPLLHIRRSLPHVPQVRHAEGRSQKAGFADCRASSTFPQHELYIPRCNQGRDPTPRAAGNGFRLWNRPCRDHFMIWTRCKSVDRHLQTLGGGIVFASIPARDLSRRQARGKDSAHFRAADRVDAWMLAICSLRSGLWSSCTYHPAGIGLRGHEHKSDGLHSNGS